MSTNQEEARQRLLDVLPHLRLALEEAKLLAPDGTVGLAVIITRADGTGRLTARFHGKEFFEDLAVMLGIAGEPLWLEPTAEEDDREEASEPAP